MSRIFVDEKSQVGVLILLFFIAIASRFYGIWLWDIVDDEYFTATKSYERFASIVNPAYYSLVVLTYSIFGSEMWLSRIPAFVLAVFSIPLLYLSWAKGVGRNVALFASIIIIFSAWHLWFSQFARFYIGVFLFSSLAYLYFFRAIYIAKVSNLVWGLVFSVIAISFHVTAIFVPVSVAVAYLAIFLFMKKDEYVCFINIKYYLVVCLVAGVMISPMMYGVLSSWVLEGESWGRGPVLIIPQLVKYIQISIVVAALVGWLVLLKKDKVAAVFFTFSIVIPCLILIVLAIFMSVSPSYAFYILPLAAILAGIACEEVRVRLSSTYSVAVSGVVLFLILSTLLPSFASHYLDRSSFHFDAVVEFVDENFQENDQVLSFKAGFELPDKKLFTLLPFISFSRDNSIDWNNELQPLLNTNNRTWIVVSSKRRPLALRLEQWLFCNAQLVWQKYAVRLDYEVNGFQVFLVSNNAKNSRGISICL